MEECHKKMCALTYSMMISLHMSPVKGNVRLPCIAGGRSGRGQLRSAGRSACTSQTGGLSLL